MSNPRPPCPPNPPLRDTHSLFCQAVDLTKSSLGIFDHRLTPSFSAETTSADKIFLTPEECYLNLAFSSLCNLYFCPQEKRGFTKATYMTEDHHKIQVIEGRRQRQIDTHLDRLSGSDHCKMGQPLKGSFCPPLIRALLTIPPGLSCLSMDFKFTSRTFPGNSTLL